MTVSSTAKPLTHTARCAPVLLCHSHCALLPEATLSHYAVGGPLNWLRRRSSWPVVGVSAWRK